MSSGLLRDGWRHYPHGQQKLRQIAAFDTKNRELCVLPPGSAAKGRRYRLRGARRHGYDTRSKSGKLLRERCRTVRCGGR
jgi:hypothetical protein